MHIEKFDGNSLTKTTEQQIQNSKFKMENRKLKIKIKSTNSNHEKTE